MGPPMQAYAEVKAPGYLHIYKDKALAVKAFMSSSGFAFFFIHLAINITSIRNLDPSSSTDPSATVLDLRSIMDFKQVKSKEGYVLEIDMVNGSEQLRFKQESDLDHWKRLLQEWKDFHTDYGSLYAVRPSSASLSGNPVVAVPRASISAAASGGSRRESASSIGGSLAKKSERSQKDRDELNSVQVDDEEDLDEEKGVSLRSWLFPSKYRIADTILF